MSKRSNGEGTIYKRKDERWCAAYYDEEFQRHYVYGKTQAEVKQKLKEKKEAKNKRTDTGYTLQVWLNEYLEKYKKNELKKTTYGSYVAVCNKHIAGSKLGNMKLDKITADNLQKYYNDKIKEGYSSKTVRSIETIINSGLEMAVRLRIISENPNLYTTIPKKEKYEAHVLSREEVQKILKEAKNEELYPIVVTTVFSGLRKGEVMGLLWKQIDFENRKIRVAGSLCRIEGDPDENGVRHAKYEILEPKTKKSIRIIPMLDEVYEALQEQKRRQKADKIKYGEEYRDYGFVFANPLGEHLAQRPFMTKYHNFLRKYGITDIRFHDLRHTFASLLIESDVSMKVVQELLGHSTITTSMDIYTHISDKAKEKAMLQIAISKIEDEVESTNVKEDYYGH